MTLIDILKNINFLSLTLAKINFLPSAFKNIIFLFLTKIKNYLVGEQKLLSSTQLQPGVRVLLPAIYYYRILDISTGTALVFTTTIILLDIFLPEASDFKPNIGRSTCFIEVGTLFRMMLDCSLSVGQGGQADDLFLHPSHALCPPQPRPVRGDGGEAEHAQQADQDCETVTEVERPSRHLVSKLKYHDEISAD